MYVLLNETKHVIQVSVVGGEGWILVDPEIFTNIDMAYANLYRYIDGQLIFDTEKYYAQAEEQARYDAAHDSHPTPQQEIETLKTENAELKQYVELISDSVVDLAMRTLKEV